MGEDGFARGRNLPRRRLFELLGADRPRCVLVSPHAVVRPVALADLAREVAGRGSRNSLVTPDEEAVYRSLYHCHVPKVADADVVVHDRERDTVEPADRFERVVAAWDSLTGIEGEGPDLE